MDPLERKWAKMHISDPSTTASPSHSSRNVGPAVPPSSHLSRNVGPAVPPSSHLSRNVGQAVPPSSHLLRNIGPAVPSSHSSRNIGPAVPSSHSRNIGPAVPSSSHSSRNIGPAVPSSSHSRNVGPDVPSSSSSSSSYSPRKVGPAVPPKPQKKPQPLVPKSYSLNGPSEPSYSTPLQSNTATYTNLPSRPPLSDRSHMGRHTDTATYSNLPTTYSNISPLATYSNTYSNISSYSDRNVPPGSKPAHMFFEELDELPPPPPEPADYAACQTNFPPPPEELPPPPSPVSSSYSELRRATYQPGYQSSYTSGYPHDYSTYGPSSQSSTTYESIYEPINPRPPSQLSSRSNYSLYAPYVSGSQQGTLTRSGGGAKEAEVDALTDLLVQSMDGSGDSDVYGVCTKCNEKVVGEESGCTAMDQVYHITCFTCCHCDEQLQGKPFYALEGKPYCEADYKNTLEKCSVCLDPILDRILRATGRPYHPQCFRCVVCSECLDGIPFTVDATNQIHCIVDFHKKFAPRCCVCELPIMPQDGEDETVRVVALDRSFHIACYKCEDCGLLLSSEAEGRGCYPLDDHILCKSCNATRVQNLSFNIVTEL